MITELKTPKGVTKLERFKFPKGITPNTSTWRTTEWGIRQIKVDLIIKEDESNLSLADELEDTTEKIDAKGRRHIVGWATQEEANYIYEREWAEKETIDG